MNDVYGLFCACDECRRTRPGEIRYVGQTITGMESRFRNHIRNATNPSRTRESLKDLPVYRWMKKHGPENIRATLLDTSKHPEDLDLLERMWISTLGTFTGSSGLNLSEGGIGLQGYTHTEESRHKMRKRFESREERMKSSKPGESHHLATFKESEVSKIKRRLWNGERASDIASELGVPIHRIQQINVDASWAHVEWPIGPRVKPRRRSVFSADQRREVQTLLKSGESMHSVARQFGVSVTAVFRVAHPSGTRT